MTADGAPIPVLTAGGALAAARRRCEPGCFCYHATWRVFRLAGLKANPAWHAGFYQRALADHRIRYAPRVLVCGSSDETMPRVLAALLPGACFVVADACRTPLALAGAWGRATGTTIITVHSRAPRLEEVTGEFDLVVTDGLLSLLPTVADRRELIGRLAELLAPGGLLLYTTRVAGPAGRLEYDLPGRAVQAAAAACWPGPAAQRWRLARHRLLAPARPSPFPTPGDLVDAFAGALPTVRLFTRAGPPSTALRLHPAFLTGCGSVCAAVAATTPTGGRP